MRTSCQLVIGGILLAILASGLHPSEGGAAQSKPLDYECELLKREYPFVGMAFDIKSDRPLISTVTPGSPALLAGIRPGDVVLAYNRIEVSSYNQVIAAIGQLEIGDALTLTVDRSGTVRDFPVIIGRKPVGYTYMDCALSDAESPEVEEKIHWLVKAADLGYVNAMMILGEIYSNEEPRNYEAAVDWFSKAAALGDSEAQLLLGMYYYYGDDVKKNRVEAARWFRLAADQGVADAQITLGLMYSTGDGVEKDHAEAVKWLQMAAGQGVAKANSALGVIYNYGLGVAPDPAKALKLFEDAASHGDANAKYHLALFYMQGTVVKRDQHKAGELLIEAEKLGSLEAKALRESLSR